MSTLLLLLMEILSIDLPMPQIPESSRLLEGAFVILHLEVTYPLFKLLWSLVLLIPGSYL
jgi:hypothetical protein